MKKIIIYTILAACFAAGFASCIEDQEDPEVVMDFAEEVRTVNVTGVQDTVSITVLSNTRWRIDTLPAALDRDIITKYYAGTDGNTAASGEGTLYFIVAENRDPNEQGVFEPRTTTVTVFTDDKYADQITRVLTVEQEAGSYRINLAKESEEVGAAAGTVEVNYDINGDWEVEVPAEIRVSSRTEEVMRLQYPANTDTQQGREFVVTLKMTVAPYPTAEFRIIQSAAVEPEP